MFCAWDGLPPCPRESAAVWRPPDDAAPAHLHLQPGVRPWLRHVVLSSSPEKVPGFPCNHNARDHLDTQEDLAALLVACLASTAANTTTSSLASSSNAPEDLVGLLVASIGGAPFQSLPQQLRPL